MPKVKNRFTSFRVFVAYKRIQTLIISGLFFAGNLVSTWPIMANPIPSANIVVDMNVPVNQRPTIDVTPNGIDQINIAHPNNAGVSHNRFNQYNVNEQGQILNNASTITNTKLAGQIIGNPHLKDGKNARLILNEVTGYSPTRLLGYTEIAGKQAALIIANPSGITCAGCGFINTARTSLATGKPNLDANGYLQSITVSEGTIGFDGKGGNFAEVPVLDIISRKVRINAPVNGQDIRVVAGRNSYHYDDGTATPLASDGSTTPEFAIETSVLGGMTGNHIQMLVNEKGAGVRVDGRMASTAGDMELTADGKLVVSGDLTAQNQFKARVTTVENTGTLGANNGLSLQASSLTNSGKIIAAGNQESAIAVDNNLDNSGSIVTQPALRLTAQKINNQQSGSVRSQKNMTITGQNLINNGKISADTGIIQATVNGDISNTGSIAANNHIILSASGNINNYSGYILTDQTGYIHIQGNNLNNQKGLIQSNSGLINLAMNSVNNNGGSVVTRDAAININAPQYIFNNNGQIGSQQSGSINLITQNDLQNNNGKISTRLGNVFLQSNKLMNNSGIILAGIEENHGDITIRSGDIGNSGGVIQSTSGLVDVSMGGYTDTGSGLIYAGKILKINATEDVSVGGDIQGQQGLSLSARSLTLNNAKASLSSLIGDSMISLLNGLVNAGNIFVNQGILTITAGSLANNGQIVTNSGTLSVTTKGDISNRSGHILTKNDAITLKAEGKIDNVTGQIGSQNNGAITLQGGDVNNENGLIRTGIGDISLTVASLDNNSGSILTRQGDIGISSSQGMMNRLGQIGNQVSGNLIITAGGDINNQQGQLITPSGWVRITGRDLDNRLGKIGSNNGNIGLQISRLSNGQGIILAGAGSNIGDITLQSGDIENSHGTIQATNGSVNAFLNNYTDMGSGVVYAGKSLQINATGDMYIEGAIQSQDQLNLQAHQLNLANAQSSISSLNSNESLTITNDLISNGNIYASLGGLWIKAASLENSGSLYGKGLVDLQIGQSLKNKGIFADNKLIGGVIQSDGDITLNTANTENSGFIQSLQGINLQLSGDIQNQSFGGYSGIIQSGNGKDIHINAQNLQNDTGQILSDAAVILNIQNNLVNSGYLQAKTAINLTTPNLKNNAGHILALGGDLLIGLLGYPAFLTAIDNTNGKIQANGNITIHGSSYRGSEQSLLTSQQHLQAQFTGDVVNNGQMVANSDLKVTASSLVNDEKGLIYSANGNIALTVFGEKGLDNQGNIQAVGHDSQLLVNASTLTNQGIILSKNGAVLTANQQLDNQRNQDVFGKIITQGGDLSLNAPILNNDGLMISSQNLKLTTPILTNAGYVSAGGLLDINAAHSITNKAAASSLNFNNVKLVSGSLVGNNVQLLTQNIDNQNGWIQGTHALTLTADVINNHQKGVILSTLGDVTLQGSGSSEDGALPAVSVSNENGNIQAYNRLWIATQHLDNSNGVLTSQNGNIRLDQGYSGAALQSFVNEGGILQSLKDLTLAFSQFDNAENSKILAGGLLSLTIGSDFTNMGTLWGGQGINLILSSLINGEKGMIGADHGNVHIDAKNGNVTNYGVIKNIDTNAGNLVIQTQNLMNDKGSILSNSNIDLQVAQNFTNQNGGEITAYNQGNIHFTGSNFDNAGLLLAGGLITGSTSGDINNNTNGYIYGSKGVALTSNTQITNNAQGQMGTGSGTLSLAANTLIFNAGGQLIADNGGIVVHASSSIRNGSWLQSMGDIQMITPTLDNTKGILLSKNGSIIIQSDQNGHGLGFLNNNSGIIQSAKDLTLYTQSLENENGKILTFSALGNGATGNMVLYADAQGQALTTLHLSNNGVIQSSGDVTFRAQSSGLSSTGTIIASQNLRAVLDGDLNNNNILFTSLGKTTSQSLSDNQNPGVNLTVNGNYTINEDGGITSGGDLMLTANQITNNGVLIASNNMELKATRLTNNVKGLLSSSNNMVLTINGNLDNFGVLQADQGSMTIQAIGDITNIGGLIRTQSANGDITLTANSFTNKYSGTLIEQKINSKTVYDTAVNAVGQPYDGISNKDFAKTYADEGTWKSSDLSQYFYNSDVKILQINTPKGMYTTDGKPASGYFYMFLSGGNNKANTRVEITATGTQTILNGTAAIISAGRDLTLHTTGNITNDVSHIEAGKNMDLKGASLNNVGHKNDAVYKLACYNPEFCRYLYPKDNRNNPLPNYTIDGSYEGDKNKIILDGHSMIAPPMHIWGSNTVNRGLSGTIVAGGNLLGQFTGQVNNTTIIEHALPSDFTQSNPILPSGKLPKTEQGESGQEGMKGPGESPLEDKTAQVTAINGQDPILPAYSGVTNPQGVDPGLHVTLPGFNGGGSTNVSDILSSITGGQALFRPNPNVTGGNSSLNGISGEGITGNPSIPDSAKPSNNMNGNHEITVNNTATVQPGSNYLIETRPQYTSVKQLYGSQYLLDRLNIHGSYMFLGDSGFDSQYIQQQYIQATGQSYPGGTYRTASDALKTLLDNAASQSGKLGLQFGEALTAEQQAALDEDIVWYVPQIVDGKTVLVPQLYLSPKTAILSGGSIKGKDVRLTAGSINNSGLMEGTHSIGLMATNGNIANIGGTIKGGDVSLVARDGSVINSDTVNHYLVDGGHASYLGSQGQIMASGTLGMQASDSITTHGGLIQSGSDLALSAGTINIGAAELDASASSITHASDGRLSFTGNQTKHYGTTIISGGNTALQTTSGDMTLSGSNLFSGGNVSLNSKGKIGLNTVTDSGMTDLKGHKSGAFTSSAFENRNSYEKQVGSSIIAGGSLSAIAQKDVDISGRLSGVQDVTVASKAGSITEHALTFKQNDYDYHHTEKTGFFGNETGLSAQVGTKKVSDKNTSSSELHSGSLISSTKGSVVLDAEQDININASKITAGKDIALSGNSINLNTVQNITKGDQFHKDTFTGLAVGIDAQSVIGGVAKGSIAASKATNSTTAITNGLSAGSVVGKAVGGKLGMFDKEAGAKASASEIEGINKANNSQRSAVDYNLMGVSASIGHSSNKSHSTETTTTDVGSTVTAGGTVKITAKKDINATASTISGNDVIFNAGGDINLKAGYKTTQTESKSSGQTFGVGASASVGIIGGSVATNAGMILQKGHSKSLSKSGIDSVVNGTHSVTINNHDGNLTLNGAQIVNKTPDINHADGTVTQGVASNGSITIDTGNLTITTPQNNSKYDGNNYSVNALGSLPIASIGFGNGKPPDIPYTQGTLGGGVKDIHNNYQSTEQTMSGIAAGSGGLKVNASGTTTLNGGSITSTADISKNQITTGQLIGNSLNNHSVWSGLNVSGSETVKSQYTVAGTATEAKNNKLLPGNVVNNAKGPQAIGNVVTHNEHTVTDAVIGGNIVVNAGSTTGKISNDAEAANGYIKDRFDANKMQNNFNHQNDIAQNITTILTNIVNAVAPDKGQSQQTPPGQISDHDIGMMVSSGLGSIGGALFGKGDVGATVAGVAAGDMANIYLPNIGQTIADQISPNQKNPKDPKNKNGVDISSQTGKLTPSDNEDQTSLKNKSKHTYDTVTDINKIVAGFAHDVIVGGVGALTGIIAGGGNVGLDATAGGLTSLKQNAPKITKPKNQKNNVDAASGGKDALKP